MWTWYATTWVVLQKTGSVTVSELFGQTSYSNVHHLEATVRSGFPPELQWRQVLAALLPGGSVTGTPKRRAVEFLHELEPFARSVYTGAIGYLSHGGAGDFNLPIRTLYHDGAQFYLHSGGGIVADSDPVAEYEECRDQGSAYPRTAGLTLISQVGRRQCGMDTVEGRFRP